MNSYAIIRNGHEIVSTGPGYHATREIVKKMIDKGWGNPANLTIVNIDDPRVNFDWDNGVVL